MVYEILKNLDIFLQWKQEGLACAEKEKVKVQEKCRHTVWQSRLWNSSSSPLLSSNWRCFTLWSPVTSRLLVSALKTAAGMDSYCYLLLLRLKCCLWGSTIRPTQPISHRAEAWILKKNLHHEFTSKSQIQYFVYNIV